MRPLHDIYLLELDIASKSQMKLAGRILYRDPSFSGYHGAIQHGVVRHTPDNPDANIGDKVYFHHTVEDNHLYINSENILFRCNEYNLYCKVVKDEIVMLGDYILVEPIFEDKSNITTTAGIQTKLNTEKIPQRGIVRAIPEDGEEYGVKVGDKVVYTQNSEYTIKVEGTRYYMMQMKRDIFAVVKGGGLNLLDDWALITPLSTDAWEQQESGIFLIQKNVNSNIFRGIVDWIPRDFKGCKVGDEVLFERREYNSFEWKGDKLYVVRTSEDGIVAVFGDK